MKKRSFVALRIGLPSVLSAVFSLFFVPAAFAQTVIDLNRGEISETRFGPFVFKGAAYFADSVPQNIPADLLVGPQYGMYGSVPRAKIFVFRPETASVELLKDLSPASVTMYSNNPSQTAVQSEPAYLFSPVVYEDHFYFLAFNHRTGYAEVWRSDGTAENTIRIYVDERPSNETLNLRANAGDRAAIAISGSKLLLIRDALPLFLLDLDTLDVSNPASPTVTAAPAGGVPHFSLTIFSKPHIYASFTPADGRAQHVYFAAVPGVNRVDTDIYTYNADDDRVTMFFDFTPQQEPIVSIGIIDDLHLLEDGTKMAIVGNQTYSQASGDTLKSMWILDMRSKRLEALDVGEEQYTVNSPIRSLGKNFVVAMRERVGNERVVGSLLFVDASSEAPGISKYSSSAASGRIVQPAQLFSSAEHKERLYLTLFDELGDAVYRTDGTTGGTELVHRINEQSVYFGLAQGFFSVEDDLYFFALTRGYEEENPDSNVQTSIIRTGGLPGSPYDVLPYTAFTRGITRAPWGLFSIATFKDELVFAANDGTSLGEELWRSDGTALGTHLLLNIVERGFRSSTPHFSQGAVVGEKFFFSADVVETVGDDQIRLLGSELYVLDATGKTLSDVSSSDLTAFEINSAVDEQSGVGVGSLPRDFESLGDLLLFGAQDQASGRELWASDGTTFRLVKEFYPGADSGPETDVEGERLNFSPGDLQRMGDKVYLSAGTEGAGRELWVTDGTENGTQRLADVIPGAEGSSPRYLFPFAGKLYFQAYADVEKARRLYRYDPDVGTVELFLDREAGSFDVPSPGDDYRCFLFHGVYREKMFFSFFNGESSDPVPGDNGERIVGYELWITDGTPQGTAFLKDINKSGISEEAHDSAFSYPGTLDPSRALAPKVYNDKLFFMADDGVHGPELWVVDAAANDPGEIEAEDVTLYKDVYPGPRGSFPRGLTVYNDRLYFIAEHPGYGEELMSIKDGGADLQVKAAGSLPVSLNVYDFEGVPTGAVQEASFLVENTGSADLTLTSLSFDQAATEFAVDYGGTLPVVAPGSSHTFTVSFTPGAVEAYSTTLSIVGDGVDTQTILFRGAGVEPLRVSIEGLGRIAHGHEESFGVFSSSSPQKTKTLIIESKASLEVGSIVIEQGDAIHFTSNGPVNPPADGSSVLLSDASGAISYAVVFDPSAAGTGVIQRAQATINLASGDRHLVKFNGAVGGYDVVAQGESAALSSPIIYDFGDVFLGETAEVIYSIRNSSPLSLIFLPSAFEGSEFGYSVSPNGGEVQGSSVVDMTFSFTPSEPSDSPHAGSYTLSSAEGTFPETVFNFTVQVLHARIRVQIDGETTFLSSGATYRRTGLRGTEHLVTYKITNEGSGDLRITELGLLGTGFEITEPSVLPAADSPMVVPAGGDAQVTVRYANSSNSSRARSGRLSIVSNSREDGEFEVDLRLTFVSGGAVGSYGRDEADGVSVRVYPNPATDNVLVSTALRGDYGVRIYGISGALLRETFFSGTRLNIPLSDYAAGVYVLEFVGLPSGTVRVKLFVE